MNQLGSTVLISQACAVPFRAHQGALEFCLITSLNKGRWGFPKGTIDPGETYLDTALKEAYEEAGLRGEVVDEPLGQYDYAKWGASLRVTVVLMRVTEIHDRWLEAGLRQRIWCSAEEAQRRVAKADPRRFLEIAIERLAARNHGASTA